MISRSTSLLPLAAACLALVFSSATPALAGRSAPAPVVETPDRAVIERRLDQQGYSPRLVERADALDPLGRAILAERALETRREGGFVIFVVIGFFVTASAVAVIWWLHHTGHLHWFHPCGPNCQPHPPAPTPEHQPPGEEMSS